MDYTTCFHLNIFLRVICVQSNFSIYFFRVLHISQVLCLIFWHGKFHWKTATLPWLHGLVVISRLVISPKVWLFDFWYPRESYQIMNLFRFRMVVYVFLRCFQKPGFYWFGAKNATSFGSSIWADGWFIGGKFSLSRDPYIYTRAG